MSETITKEQYEKDCEFSKKIRSKLEGYKTISQDPINRRFEIKLQDGTIDYVTFDDLTELSIVEKRMYIYANVQVSEANS